jgi:hypothetical protein
MFKRYDMDITEPITSSECNITVIFVSGTTCGTFESYFTMGFDYIHVRMRKEIML